MRSYRILFGWSIGGPIGAIGTASTSGGALLHIERILQFHVAVLVCLGIFLLGMSQTSFQLPAIALLATVGSVIFTDILGWVRLNRVVANIAALLALGLSVSEFLSFESTSQLLSVAKLLLYTQIVLLFQKKSIRLYWHLLTLSLLQVVVAAALNYGSAFGALMVVYMFVAIATLSVFFVFRETIRLDPTLRLHDGSSTITVGSEPRLDWPDRSSSTTGLQAPQPLVSNATRLTGDIPLDLLRRGVGWGLLRRTTGMGLGTLALAGLVFVATPRQGKGRWNFGTPARQRSVGFSETVRLGALGQVSQNTTPVMQVTFISERTGEPMQLSEPPLLRGTILTSYRDGIWKLAHVPEMQNRLSRPPLKAGLVRQRTLIEPLDTPVLFGVYPYHTSSTGPKLELDLSEGYLARNEWDAHRRFSYELTTSGIYATSQHTIAPGMPYDNYMPTEGNWLNSLNSGWILLELPTAPGNLNPLATLKAEADAVLAQSNVADDDTIGRARALERHFLTGDFEYSLTGQRTDRSLDPVEDFIKNHRRGHCEYFATALTLMLRCKGIPARMVVGFKGADWNPLGSFYQVRQLHAHTWVEVLLPTISETDPAYQGPDHKYGYWLRLDPTPGTPVTSTFAEGGVLGAFADLGDYVESLWKTYVMGLNAEQQQTAIYKPLAERMREYIQRLSGLVNWERISSFVVDARDWLFANWLSWRGALILAGSMLGLVVVYRTVRLARRWWRSRNQARLVQEQANAHQVEFYKRLESLLHDQGMVRAESETQREFLLSAAGQMSENRNGSGQILARVSPLLQSLLDAFYRVRFGQHTLDNREATAVQQSLSMLEQAFAQAGPPAPHAWNGQRAPSRNGGSRAALRQ